MKQFLKEFKKGMKSFGENISIIVNSLLLLVVYFIGVGLTFALAKVFRKSFLDTKFTKESYWSDLNLKNRTIKEHYRQF